MKPILVAILALLLLLSTIFGMLAWFDFNPREPALGWTARISSAVIFPASLIGLFVLLMQPEAVPDFLGTLGKPRMGRGDIVFVFDCVERDGWAAIEIHYQNRYTNAANVVVAVQPSQSFTMSRNKIDPILVQFACGPAAYGIIRVPFAVKRQYQGKSQQFDVAEQTKYPAGRGPILRNVVGPAMSRLKDSELFHAAVALARLALTGHLHGVKFQSRVKVSLPMGVAEAGKLPAISQEEIWELPVS